MILNRFQIIPLNIEFCVIATVTETKAMAYFMVINLVTKCSTIPKAQIGYINEFTFGFQMRKVHTPIINIKVTVGPKDIPFHVIMLLSAHINSPLHIYQ